MGVPPSSASGQIQLQAEEHPLVREAELASSEQIVLHLMHERAYDEAARYCAARTVLDVGCNTGYGAVRLAAHAARVVGVDVSPAAIEEARGRAGADRVEFLVVDGVRLPFEDETFDVVVSFQVIEHIAQPLAYLREIRRVLRRQGTALFTTPNASFRLDPGMAPWNRFHVREYRPSELRELLEHVFAGAEVKGMFATPELYEVERARVQRSLVHHRHVLRAAAREARAESSANARKRRTPGSLAASIAQRLLTVVLADRKAQRADSIGPTQPTERTPTGDGANRPATVTLGDRPAERPAGDLRGFTTADLTYSDENVDAAMDLLAICVTD
jgi:SAM-dependent methyltransferase